MKKRQLSIPNEYERSVLIYSYVLGGTHLTNPALLSTRILKELTATEDAFYG